VASGREEEKKIGTLSRFQEGIEQTRHCAVLPDQGPIFKPSERIDRKDRAISERIRKARNGASLCFETIERKTPKLYPNILTFPGPGHDGALVYPTKAMGYWEGLLPKSGGARGDDRLGLLDGADGPGSSPGTWGQRCTLTA
jgi:hypothetical protein